MSKSASSSTQSTSTTVSKSKSSPSKSNPSKSNQSPISIENLDEIFGYPPLIHDEDIKDYEALEHQIRMTLSPKDTLEEIWVRDIVDDQWEILRYKRIKSAILNASNHRSLQILKSEIFGVYESKRTLEAKTYPEALKELNLPPEALLAKAYVIYINQLTAIENNIHKLECRRNAAYRQLEDYRNTKSKKRSDVVDLHARTVRGTS